MRDARVPYLFFLAAVLLGACGGARTSTRSSLDEPTVATQSSGAPGEGTEISSGCEETVARAPGPMTRAEAEALVARGLGRFLARVEVSPVLASGRFVGFRLDRAQDLPDWQAAGADIRLGDVIVRVNGVRIEHPEQALWAFEQLRIVRAIDVELLRNGAATRVQSPIVDPVAGRGPVASVAPVATTRGP